MNKIRRNIRHRARCSFLCVRAGQRGALAPPQARSEVLAFTFLGKMYIYIPKLKIYNLRVYFFTCFTTTYFEA